MLKRDSLAGTAIDGSGELNECHNLDKSVFRRSSKAAGCTNEILPICDRIHINLASMVSVTSIQIMVQNAVAT
jgi:hypothetical protein